VAEADLGLRAHRLRVKRARHDAVADVVHRAGRHGDRRHSGGGRVGKDGAVSSVVECGPEASGAGGVISGLTGGCARVVVITVSRSNGSERSDLPAVSAARR
jgi:hypothetical protein